MVSIDETGSDYEPDHRCSNDRTNSTGKDTNLHVGDDPSSSMEVDDEKKPLLGDRIKQDDHEGKEGKCYIPKRHEVLLMGFLGTTMMFAMRVNVSVTMAVMTNSSYTTREDDQNETVETCRSHNNTMEDDDDQNGGEFLWSSHEQELVLAGFFYGYSIAQIPAGWLTDKIGGTRVFGICMFLSAAVSLFSPIAAELGPSYLMAVRILCGVGESGTLPALGSIVARWYPRQDYSAAFSFAISGAKFGPFIGTVLSGVISSSDLLGGWPLTYYSFGGFTLILVLIWIFLIYETPGRHPRISSKEKKYLSNTVITEKSGDISIPVLAILTSIPVWAMILTSFGGTLSNQIVFTNQPIYLKHVQGMDIELIGIAAALPFALETVTLIVGGIISNKLISSQFLSISTTRKLMTLIGLTISAIFFLLLAFVGCNTALSVVFMIGAVGFNGVSTCGYYVNLMDIAPRLAGSLLGLVNGTCALAAAVGPYVVGVFTPNQADVSGWQKVFFISGGVNAVACLIFLVFGSGVEQKWAKENPKDHTDSSFNGHNSAKL